MLGHPKLSLERKVGWEEMIKVKMKVKNMIWLFIGLLFTVFVIIPFFNIVLANNLSNSRPEIAEKLYRINLKYPTRFMKDESLYKLSEEIMEGFGRYNIMMQAKIGGEPLDYDDATEAIENYEKIIKNYPKSGYYINSYKRILDSYIYLGDGSNLDKWIEWGSSKDNIDINKMSDLYRSYTHFINREYDESDEILEGYSLGNENLDYIYYFLRGHIEFVQEDFDKALEYYEKASDIGWQHKTSFLGNYVADRRNHWLQTLRYNKGDNKIRGKVTAGGVGIPFVEVYLQYPNQGYSSNGGDFIAITDKNGYFETIGIKDGKYEIGIGIGMPIVFDKVYMEKGIYYIELEEDMEFNFEFTSPMKITRPGVGEIVKDNKFTVEWENIDGADYYNVLSIGFGDSMGMEGSSIRFHIEDENGRSKIKDNTAIFDLELLRGMGAGTMFSDEDMKINPEAIVGYFYPGTESILVVNAYDKGGNLLNSSLPIISYYEGMASVKIENGELTEGEKIILSSNYEEAIEYYENILSKDKNNQEALKYLAKIHMVNWKKDKKEMDKAIDYGNRFYKLTENTEILEKILGQMDSNDYRQYSDNVEDILVLIAKKEITTEFYSTRGKYYKAIGEFEKARADLLVDEHDYLYENIIYIDIYLGEEDKALDRLRNKDINFYFINKINLIKGIEGLSKLDKEGSEYKEFKEYLSKLIKRKDGHIKGQEVFHSIYNNIKDPYIKIILNEIKEDNRW